MEVLAQAIRDNQNIEGIMINDTCKKINLLADDGILALKYTQSTFNTILILLHEFALLSNLRINKGKSLIVRMGKNKDYSTCLQGAKYFPHCHGNPFRYLGID